jgi:hypothetical protein
MRERSRPGEPLVDRSVGHGRYNDAVLLAGARVLHARDLDQDERCWSVIQPVAGLFADAVLRLATARADELRLLRMKLDALPRQIRGKLAPAVRSAFALLRSCRRSTRPSTLIRTRCSHPRSETWRTRCPSPCRYR